MFHLSVVLLTINLHYCIASESQNENIALHPYDNSSRPVYYSWLGRDPTDEPEIELFDTSISDVVTEYVQTNDPFKFNSILRQDSPTDIGVCIIDHLKQSGKDSHWLFIEPLISWLSSTKCLYCMVKEFLESDEGQFLIACFSEMIQAVFIAAARSNNINLVKFIAKNFPENFVPEAKENSAFNCALASGNRQLVDLLYSFEGVRRWASKNKDTLTCAIEFGTLEDVKRIFESAEIDKYQKRELFYALRNAVKINRIDVVKYFLTQKNVPTTNPPSRESLAMEPMYLGRFDCARELLQDDKIIELTDMSELLSLACSEGDYEMAMYILKLSSQDDIRLDHQLLCQAARGGNLQLFRYLESMITKSPAKTNLPIILASLTRPNLQMVEYLIGDKYFCAEDVDKDDLDAITALRQACLDENRSEMRKYLRNDGIRRLPTGLVLFMAATFPQIPRSWISGWDPEMANLLFSLLCDKWTKFRDDCMGNQLIQILEIYDSLDTSALTPSSVISSAIVTYRWDIVEAFVQRLQNIDAGLWSYIMFQAQSYHQSRIIRWIVKNKQPVPLEHFLDCILYSLANIRDTTLFNLKEHDHQMSILIMLVNHVGIENVKRHLETGEQTSLAAYISYIPSSLFKQFTDRSNLLLDLLTDKQNSIRTLVNFRDLLTVEELERAFLHLVEKGNELEVIFLAASGQIPQYNLWRAMDKIADSNAWKLLDTLYGIPDLTLIPSTNREENLILRFALSIAGGDAYFLRYFPYVAQFRRYFELLKFLSRNSL